MNQERKDSIDELKQDASGTDALLREVFRKAIKVIEKAESKGIDQQEVIEFLQDQGFTKNDIDGAYAAYRSSSGVGMLLLLLCVYSVLHIYRSIAYST